MNAIDARAAAESWAGHNRRPVRQSQKRLKRRRVRRYFNALTRVLLARVQQAA